MRTLAGIDAAYTYLNLEVGAQEDIHPLIDTFELSILAFPLQALHNLDDLYKLYDLYELGDKCTYALNSHDEEARVTKLLQYELCKTLLMEPEFYQQLITWLLTSGLDSKSIAYQQLFCDLLDLTVAPIRIEELPQEMLVGVNCSYLDKLLLSPHTYDFNTRLCATALLVWNYENNINQSKVAYSNWLLNLPQFDSVYKSLFERPVKTVINQESLLITIPTNSGKPLNYQLPACTFYREKNVEDFDICANLNYNYELASSQDYKSIIESLEDSLHEIVLADNSATSVIGGSGSGKTTTIVHRVAYLVTVKLVDPQSILVLACNRNAVTEIRVKLQELIGELAIQVRVLTFQKLSLSILGRALDENTRVQFNFDNLVTEACSQFENIEDCNFLQRRFQLLGDLEHILIDDYQDINDAEYSLIKLISGINRESSVRTNIFVVGDDDQSIHKDRGADAKFILKFEEEYQAKRLIITENYRSSELIMSAANKLISHNQERYKFNKSEQLRIDRMRRNKCYPSYPVEAYTFDSTEIQAIWIQQRICSRIEQGAYLEDIAVFARNWDSLDVIRLLLEKAGIPTCNFKKDDIELVRNHVTCKLINELKSKRHELILPDKSVFEWFEACFDVWGHKLTEPTIQILLKIARDIDIERGYGITDLAMPIRVTDILTSLLEFSESSEAVRNENAVLVTTCHGAKVSEFQKVILVADGFQTDAMSIEIERRLFYVAMTRAKSELVMCSTQPAQFIYETGAEPEHLNVKIDELPEQMLCLDLTPDDIFAGHYSTKKDQQVILSLHEGAELLMEVNPHANTWDILTADGQKIGALSKQGSSKLASIGCIPGEFEFGRGEVKVKNVYRHIEIHDATGITEDWFIVIPQIRVCR